MKLLVCFVALIAVSSAAQVLQPKSLLTEIIKLIFNSIKDKLANLEIEKILLGEYGSINNLFMKNLDEMSLDKLTAGGAGPLSISNATLSLTTLSAEARAIISGLNVPQLGLLVDGESEVTVTVRDLFATFAMNCTLHNLTLEVEDIGSMGIRIGEINASLPGIKNEEANTEIINTKLAGYLTDKLPRIANENKEAIIAFLNAVFAELS